MIKPAGILFDFGETILQAQPGNYIAGDARLLEFATNNPGLSPEDIQRFANELSAEIEPVKEESMIELPVPAFYRVLFETLGLEFSISYEQMEREFWRAVVHYRPAEGIYEFLDLVESAGIRTGILSNSAFSGRTLEEELSRHNLAHRFSFVISSADYGYRKPHHRLFEAAIKKMGLSPEEIWFIGDNTECDIKGALDAGLCPVWFDPSGKGTNPYSCLEVRGWNELRDLLRQLV